MGGVANSKCSRLMNRLFSEFLPSSPVAAINLSCACGPKLSGLGKGVSWDARAWFLSFRKFLAGSCLLLLVGALTILPARACFGQELGREAPALQVTNWMRGEPVDLKLSGSNTVHVVVFWETWCDHCMGSLPLLVDLQAKMRPRGVEFVGVSPETPEVVRAFLTNSEIGAKLNFAIACDSNRMTFQSYMTTFGQSQIPRAFVVARGGTLAWYGHPLAGLEEVLQRMVDGAFDFEATKKAFAAEKLRDEYFRSAETNAEPAELAKLGQKIVSDGAANPWFLNSFAWQILQNPQLAKREAPLALLASKSACVATAWRRPNLLDTHALALFSNGQAAEAIRVEQDAINLSTNEAIRARFQQSLKSFEIGQTNLVGTNNVGR